MTAPSYFAESINSDLGFWGLRCKNYFDYLIGRCGSRDKNGPGEDEDDDDWDDLIKDRDVGGGSSQVESNLMRREPKQRSGRFDWQLMGEYCNET